MEVSPVHLPLYYALSGLVTIDWHKWQRVGYTSKYTAICIHGHNDEHHVRRSIASYIRTGVLAESYLGNGADVYMTAPGVYKFVTHGMRRTLYKMEKYNRAVWYPEYDRLDLPAYITKHQFTPLWARGLFFSRQDFNTMLDRRILSMSSAGEELLRLMKQYHIR